jgi:hypothetical protein
MNKISCFFRQRYAKEFQNVMWNSIFTKITNWRKHQPLIWKFCWKVQNFFRKTSNEFFYSYFEFYSDKKYCHFFNFFNFWIVFFRPENDISEDDFVHVSSNTQEGRANLCVICKEKKISIVFFPCAHLCLCPECAGTAIQCPLCEKFFKGYAHVVLPDWMFFQYMKNMLIFRKI